MGSATDRRQRMSQAGSIDNTATASAGSTGPDWQTGRGRAMIAPPSTVCRLTRRLQISYEMLMARGLLIRPHLPAQCRRRRPAWIESSVGEFDSQPASVLCSSFPGHPHIQCHTSRHPLDVGFECVCTRYFSAAFGRWTEGWLIRPGSLDSASFIFFSVNSYFYFLGDATRI
jgi:hypothetical protein